MKKLIQLLVCWGLFLAGNNVSAQPLSTGTDFAGNAIAVGATDPSWVITAGPIGPNVARRVTSHGAWQPTPAAFNACWINNTGNLNNSVPGIYTFERTFTVPTGLASFTTNLSVACDDVFQNLWLVRPNGTTIPLTLPANSYFLQPVAAYTETSPAAGTWKIRAQVNFIDQIGAFIVAGEINVLCGPPPCNCSQLQPSFIWSMDQQCVGHFSPSGTIPSCLTNVQYSWKVNGTPAGTGAAFNYPFPGNGVYTICLTVTGTLPTGATCSREYCKDVTVTGCQCKCEDLQASFDVNLNPQCTGNFTSTSTVPSCLHNVTYNWYVNGIFQGSGATYSYPFPGNGNYNVCLIVTGTTPDGIVCTKEVCKNVKVEGCEPCNCQDLIPVINFQTSTSNPCKVLFYAGGTAPACLQNLTYKWYANGVLIGTGSSLNYSFLSDGTYNICLIVTGTKPDGTTCTREVCKNITITGCSTFCNCSQLQPNFVANISGCSGTFTASGFIPACLQNVTYTWSVNGMNVGSSSTLNYNFPGSGTYTVCLMVMGMINGQLCERVVCRQITVNCGIVTPSGRTAPKTLEQTVNVYPNPADEQVKIDFDLKKSGQVSVLLKSIDGKVLTSETVKAESGAQHFELKVPQTVASGMIFVEVLAEGQRIVRKVEVLKK